MAKLSSIEIGLIKRLSYTRSFARIWEAALLLGVYTKI